MKRYSIKTIPFFGFLILATLMFNGCIDKDFDTPDPLEMPVGEVYTISELRQMFIENDKQPLKFTEDMSVYGVITMDGSTGNIYKSAFFEDETAAINLRMLSPGGLNQGDSIRIYLKGIVMSEYASMLQLDSVHTGNNITKLRTGIEWQPTQTDILTLLTDTTLIGKLVKLNEVEFHPSDLGSTFADGENLEAQNRILRECNGNEIIVRTSGYASFADDLVPEGNGTLVAVLARFRDDMQLYIRSYEEIEMNNPRCEGGNGELPDPVTFIDEDFQSYDNHSIIDQYGWTALTEEGERNWICRVFDQNNNHYAQATAYNSNDASNIMWMITPPIDLDAMTNPVFEFESAKAFYTHDGFSLHISTDYDGSNAGSANWQILDATLAGQTHQDNSWIHSGIIDLSSYSGIIHIAWRYQGATSQGETGTFRVDNVKLYQND